MRCKYDIPTPLRYAAPLAGGRHSIDRAVRMLRSLHASILQGLSSRRSRQCVPLHLWGHDFFKNAIHSRLQRKRSTCHAHLSMEVSVSLTVSGGPPGTRLQELSQATAVVHPAVLPSRRQPCASRPQSCTSCA